MLILHWFSEAWQNSVHFIMFPMHNNIELSIASCRLEILPSGLQKVLGLMLWDQVRLDIQHYHIAPRRGSGLAGMVILIFNINADSESLFYTPVKSCDLRQIHLLPCPLPTALLQVTVWDHVRQINRVGSRTLLVGISQWWESELYIYLVPFILWITFIL